MTPLARGLVAALFMLLAVPGLASAAGLSDHDNQWLPSPDGATWTYGWSNDAHAPVTTREQYRLDGRAGTAFKLTWTTEGQRNQDGHVPAAGEIDFNRTDSGLVNASWASTPPPPQFPVLCSQASRCGNSLAGTWFMVIWGTRSPVLQEPLLRGSEWSTTGGADSDVSSQNRVLGTDTVHVPAFPNGVAAVKVESDITQAGALGDPYGSGVRTVWWVHGVGPVRVLFQHTRGETSRSELLHTTLMPRPAPDATDYMPVKAGSRAVYRWRNSKHMRKPSTQRFTAAAVDRGSARIDVRSRSGPIKVVGSYLFANRLSGFTSLASSTQAATKAKLPPLGPRSQPRSRRRNFFTPYDLMNYGFNPVLPAYPKPGDYWKTDKGSRDYVIYGVTGWSKIRGFKTVRTPAGKFRALLVESRLSQKGFRFGSGKRLSWFAPGKGLVRLDFRHRDGSVSRVERVR